MEENEYSYTRMDRPQTAGRGRKRLQFGGAFQVLLGLLFLGSNTLVIIELGFGYFFGCGFAAGILLIVAGAVAVHKSRTSREPKHKPVKILSIVACILSFAILGIAGIGVYFDMAQPELSARVASTISMAANIIMSFLGIWGAAISIWMIWQSSTGGVEDSNKNGFGANGTGLNGDSQTEGKWAQSRKSMSSKDKANYDKEKKRRKSSMKAVVVAGGKDDKIQRQSKAFDSISMNPDPSMKSGYSSTSDMTDDSFDDDDEGYDDSDLSDGSEDDETAFDGVDMNDPAAVAAAKKRQRRRRRRKKFKKFELVKGEKKTTKAVDPFSKERKIKRTWDKKPKNEFKLTKAQELRQKKMAEARAKEAKEKEKGKK